MTFTMARRPENSRWHLGRVGSLMLTCMLSVIAQDGPLDTSRDRVEEEIRHVLQEQVRCWNRKDLKGFMNTYWQSEELTFSGGGKTWKGWQATLDRYREKYPPDKMGQLSMDQLEVTMLSSKAALVLGQWHLSRDSRPARGNFSLVLRQLQGDWKIIHDHSSTYREP